MRRLSFAIAILAAAGFALAQVCVTPFRDNLTMRDIELRSSSAQVADESQAVAMAKQNLAELDRVAHSQRLDPSWYVLYGMNCELLERWNDAIDAYTRGMTIDRRPELFFNRGLAYFHLARTDDAFADLVTAVRFNPQFLDDLDGDLRARVAAAAGVQ